MAASPHKPKRGELRIYLGAAPGVGKKYAMLGEAHRRLERGTDVVAAVVETHGRKKTAELFEGIETVPPTVIEYRGISFAELDVEAVLRRNPAVALIDEVVRAADQVELVDITPEALRRRLAHGNVDAPERVDAAQSLPHRIEVQRRTDGCPRGAR